MFLYNWNRSFHSNSIKFNRIGETISRSFNEILNAFHNLAPQYIYFPEAQTLEYNKCRCHFRLFNITKKLLIKYFITEYNFYG